MLERVLQEHEPELKPAPARVFDLAAVALAFAGPADDLQLCFIRRARRDDDPWSGQMAFPGGRRDASDPTARHVAEREAAEEVGLTLGQARLLGRLDDASLRRDSGGVLAAFVYDAGRDLPSLQADPREVDATFWISMRHLWSAEHRTTIDWEHQGDTLTFPGIAHGPDVIWGLSLRVLSQLAQLAGRALPNLGAVLPLRPRSP